MSSRYVHLRLHSEYSITDGMVRLDPVLDLVAANHGFALGITDQMNVFGGLRFYSHAIDRGIKPIFGCDLWISNPIDKTVRGDPYRLTVYCENHEGYLSLCKLLSAGWLENQYLGRGEVDWKWLTTESCKGLICLTGGPAGIVESSILHGDMDGARNLAGHLKDCFGDRFYMELQRAGRPQDGKLSAAMARMAVDLGVPVVATHPIEFLKPTDFEAHEVRVCIAGGYVLADPSRPKLYTPDQYFKSEEEMCKLFADCPRALENTLVIAERCNLDGVLQKPQLPLFPTPPGMTLDDYMISLARKGLEKRLEFLYPDPKVRDEKRPPYLERLEYELGIITKMKFPGYFLIVQDFINWSKRNGVPVGPGRGSGAGSLVAYALGITDLDPLHYGLLFERFLNPERVSMPDFDVDFCQFNRDRTIEYVKRAYGSDAVSQIATFGAMGAKAVVRDVARVLGMGYDTADKLAKLIPQKPGMDITLAKAAEMDPEFKALSQQETYADLMTYAKSLEGLTRNLGMHAGGVLIAPSKLTDFCPLYNADGRPENTISQYDKKDIERVGLVKFDFLGLTTLTILSRIKEYIDRLHRETEFDLARIPTDDKGTLKLFQNGDTISVFQFESDGMRDQLRQAKPDCLEDLVALNALYRPGPMDQIPHFINRKFGREKVEYLDQRMEPILKETYGIMVYQEQVMLVARAIAGYSLGGADLLRRAMGKKNVEEMKRQRAVFIEGAAKNNVTEKVATEIFDLMEKFAGYGFNKSHAAAYSYVAWQTAYLKVHHPACFTAGNLCLVMDQAEKMKSLCDNARAMGVRVLPPNINISEWYFTVPDERTVRFGMGAVKGVGEGIVEAIVNERAKNGPYKDIFDVAARVRSVNRKVLEQLVKAGVFDSLDPDRGKLFANVEQALQAGQAAAASAGQESLFGAEDGSGDRIVSWKDAESWSEKAKYAHEREAFGFCLTGRLWDSYAEEVKALGGPTLGTIKKAGTQGRTVVAVGMVESVRTVVGKRGKFAIVTLSDGDDTLDAVFFNEAYLTYNHLFTPDAILMVTGKTKVNDRAGVSDVIVDRAQTLEEVRRTRRPEFCMSLTPDCDFKAIKETFAKYKKDAALSSRALIQLKQVQGEIRLGPDYLAPVADDFAERVRKCPGVQTAFFRYS